MPSSSKAQVSTATRYKRLVLVAFLVWVGVTYQLAATVMTTYDRIHRADNNNDKHNDDEDDDDEAHNAAAAIINDHHPSHHAAVGHRLSTALQQQQQMDPSKLKQVHDKLMRIKGLHVDEFSSHHYHHHHHHPHRVSEKGDKQRQHQPQLFLNDEQERRARNGIDDDGPVIPRQPVPENVPAICSTYFPEEGTCRIHSCTTSNNNNNSNDLLDPSEGAFQVKHFTSADGGSTTTKKARGSMFTHSRGCAISHKYQFVYIHILKSGGMTFKSFLKNALCNGSTVLPCKAGNHVLKLTGCSEALREAGENYLVWSFARNPFSRSYSQYAMAETMKRKGRPSIPFQKFVTSTTRERKYAYQLDVTHYRPQTFFLLDRRGCPMVDFVGRLETIQRDIQTLLEIIPSPELREYVKANNGSLVHQMDTANGFKALRQRGAASGGNESLSLSLSLREMYNTSHVVTAGVVKEYISDFEFLGYNQQEVP